MGWLFHNTVVHPVCGVLWALGATRLADWLHSMTYEWTEEGAMAIDLGDVARDKITGFTGVVVCRSKWLHGCERLVLQPRELKDGKPIESAAFDEPQLELVERAALEGTQDRIRS